MLKPQKEKKKITAIQVESFILLEWHIHVIYANAAAKYASLAFRKHAGEHDIFEDPKGCMPRKEYNLAFKTKAITINDNPMITIQVLVCLIRY